MRRPHLYIKKLDIFISKQFGMLFIGTFFICQFVLMMQFLWRYIDDLIGKGLSMEILAQFFWYMSLMLVPQALPLAILLASLITFGNLGETSELTAIKAAGISLMKTFRSLIVISIFISFGSFIFQNDVAPKANMKMAQLLISMRQKSPELEIPEGVFYDGIPNCNFYVQKKDMETGKLYGIMVYRMTGSYEDQAIILADSGMLQSTAEKKHLLLTLWNGEWFENMQSQELSSSAAVPYRRETFINKRIVLDFDGGFNMSDAAGFSNDARAKSLEQISSDIDSLSLVYDSIGRAYYKDFDRMFYSRRDISGKDSIRAERLAEAKDLNVDTLYARLKPSDKQSVLNSALSTVQSESNELDFRSMVTSDGDEMIRKHKIEFINKFSLALTCIIFFFIGGPLGAIIRKGGLGVPVVTSVLVFILYYMLDNTGYRMSRAGMWAIWFGKGLAPAVLIPLAIFATKKAIDDSMVFNMDIWRELFRKMFGLRTKRHIMGKEVIIQDPDYTADAEKQKEITNEIKIYSRRHNLKKLPDPMKAFFKYHDHADHKIEEINKDLEAVIDDLSNTRDKIILNELNNYPVLVTSGHTRPFERRWINTAVGIVLPLGIFFYCRMWRFRMRLYRDLRVIRRTNEHIIARVNDMKQEGNDNEQ